MRRPRLPTTNDPHLLLATSAAALVVVLGVVGLAATRSYWLVAVTLVALLATSSILALDVGGAAPGDPTAAQPGTVHAAARDSPTRPGPDFVGPPLPGRLLVVTTEPVDPRVILRAAAADDEDEDRALERVGVMVVAPEGFGHFDVANDERFYARAREAEEKTVAGLRRAGIAAAGHVGDHDAARAVDDALFLFPAQRTLVFARGRQADAYKHSFGDREVEIIELPDEAAAS
jgi:hypothetical protein